MWDKQKSHVQFEFLNRIGEALAFRALHAKYIESTEAIQLTVL